MRLRLLCLTFLMTAYLETRETLPPLQRVSWRGRLVVFILGALSAIGAVRGLLPELVWVVGGWGGPVGCAVASHVRRAACFLSSPVGAPENLNWIWRVIYFNSEPLYGCFRALPRYCRGGWRFVRKNTPYTVPYLYHTELHSLVANRRRVRVDSTL